MNCETITITIIICSECITTKNIPVDSIRYREIHTNVRHVLFNNPIDMLIHSDLRSLPFPQLRRTDKMLAKTFSAPTRSMSMQCLSSTSEPFLAQKIDLIAELKMSKDITGIKKLKVEKARLEDRDAYADVSRQFTATNFVEQVSSRAHMRTL